MESTLSQDENGNIIVTAHVPAVQVPSDLIARKEQRSQQRISLQAQLDAQFTALDEQDALELTYWQYAWNNDNQAIPPGYDQNMEPIV